MRELQKLLVKGTKSDNPQAWDIRSTQVFIGSPTRRIEDARFVPISPGRDLDIAVQLLVDWWRSRKEPGLAVLDMAMFHYQFETMHPFTDGNGRIGRLLVLLQMMSRGLLSQPLLSVQTAMYLIGQPAVTASMLRRRFGKSPSAVQHALSHLVSVGILRAYPAGRGNLYIAPDIHKVLAAPLGAAIDVSAPLMCERGE